MVYQFVCPEFSVHVIGGCLVAVKGGTERFPLFRIGDPWIFFRLTGNGLLFCCRLAASLLFLFDRPSVIVYSVAGVTFNANYPFSHHGNDGMIQCSAAACTTGFNSISRRKLGSAHEDSPLFCSSRPWQCSGNFSSKNSPGGLTGNARLGELCTPVAMAPPGDVTKRRKPRMPRGFLTHNEYKVKSCLRLQPAAS